MKKRIAMNVSLKFKKPRRLQILALIIFSAAVIITTVLLRGPSEKRSFFSDKNAEYVQGIDVSQHNGKIEWNKVRADAEFAIIRAGFRGYGTGEISEDSRFKENAEGANSTGIPTGVYFYTQATTPAEAEEEAEFVLALIKPYAIDLPVFIDFEYPYGEDGKYTGRMRNAALSGSESAEIINAFCACIKKAGYDAGVYSSSSILTLEVKTTALDKDLYIWVADYNAKVTYPGAYDLWQYSKRGHCDGVNSKYTDLNRWYTGNGADKPD